MGTSNSGKSAIIRAMRWCLTNQPKGFGFRRHNLKPKVVTNASVLLDNGAYVTRQRNATSTNEFVVTKDVADVKLEALRGAVPEEVLTVTNISALNIQSQFSPYFLIADTAGEVARTLNEYTGLEIIDKVLKTANGNVSSATMHVTSLTEQLETQTEEAEALKYILKFKKPIARLEKNIQVYHAKKEELENLQKLLSDIEKTEQELQYLQQITALRTPVLSIQNTINARAVKQKGKQDLIVLTNEAIHYKTKFNLAQQKVILKPEVASTLQDLLTLQKTLDTKYNLQGLVLEWEFLDREIQLSTDILKLKDVVQNTLQNLETIKKNQASIRYLSQTVTELSQLQTKLETKTTVVNGLKKKLKDVDVCPLCQQKLERSLV